VGVEQLDAEAVETVAGVVRLLRRAAELVQAEDEGGSRSSRHLLALEIGSAADEASSLLPRRARLEGPTPVGQASRASRIGGALAASDLSRGCTIPAAEPQCVGRRADLGGEYRCRRISPLQEGIDYESGPCSQTGYPRTTDTRSQVVHGFAGRSTPKLRRDQGPNVDHLWRSPIAKRWTPTRVRQRRPVRRCGRSAPMSRARGRVRLSVPWPVRVF
jgi:hypothetical protein